MDEAILRLQLASDAGADVCFIEGVKNSELLKSTVKALEPKPVLVNVISGGLTPSFTCQEAEDMGAKIISTWARQDKGSPEADHFCSLFSGIMCRRRSRNSSCDALVEKNWNRLQLGERNGPQSVLRRDVRVSLTSSDCTTYGNFFQGLTGCD